MPNVKYGGKALQWDCVGRGNRGVSGVNSPHSPRAPLVGSPAE